jgi:hypothetical protein
MAGPAATVAEQICAAGYKTGLGRLPFPWVRRTGCRGRVVLWISGSS